MPFTPGPVPLFTFASFDDPSIAHGISTRAGGLSDGAYASLNLGASVGDDSARVETNRARFARALGFPAPRLVTTPQVHGDGVLVVDESNAEDALRIRADILVTTRPGYLLMQRFADCVPLLFWHASARAVAVAHAGWRGTALGVAGRTVAAIREHTGGKPVDLRAAIGPSIGPCCFEVGDEVLAQFVIPDGAVCEVPRGRPHLDLWELNRRALVRAGVPAEHIEVARVCTRCEHATFFSHRALGYPAGRFGGGIGIRPGHAA